MREEWLGVLYLGLTVIMWSLAPSYASKASQKNVGLDAVVFNAWRIFIAATATLPLAILYGFPYAVPWLDPWFELGVFAGGVLSTVVGDTLFVYSIARIGASFAIPIAYMFVVLSAVTDYMLGLQSIIVIPASIIAVIGVWASYAGVGRKDPGGVLAALATAFIWTISLYGYNYAASVLAAGGFDSIASSMLIAEVRAIYSSIAFAPYVARRLVSNVRGVLWEAMASSLTGYVVGSITFIASLAVLAPSIVSLGLALTPITTQFVAWLVAGENLSKRAILGSTLVGLAIAFIALA